MTVFSQESEMADEYIKKAQKAYRVNLEYDSARDYFSRAADLLKEINKPNKLAHVFYQVGMTYYIQSDYSNALKYAYQAKKTMTDSVSCHVKLNNDLSIGRIKYALKQKEDALAYVHSLEPEIASCNDINIKSLATNYLAVVHYELGHVDTAEKYLYQSLNCAVSKKIRQVSAKYIPY